MCLPGPTMDADIDKMLQEKDIKIEKSELIEEETVNTPVLLHDEIDIKCETFTYLPESSNRLTDSDFIEEETVTTPGIVQLNDEVPIVKNEIGTYLPEPSYILAGSESVEGTITTPHIVHWNHEINIKCEPVPYSSESSHRLAEVTMCLPGPLIDAGVDKMQQEKDIKVEKVNKDQLEENGWNCLQHNKKIRNKQKRTKGRVIAICNVCNKSFKRRCHLDSHLRTHYGEKPFMCGICNKLFSWKSDLAKHLRIHSGEKPHRCESCDKSFSRRDHLVSHSYIHSGDKQHLCIVCSKRFSRKDHLQGHMRVHSGEKRHRCIVCNRTFSHKRYMVKHMCDLSEGKLAPSNISVNICESACKTELDNICD